MKKFKRSLCLVLVLAFVVGLCSAGITASASDFSDDADILYKDAVDVLAGLGVLVGYPEGDFKPTAAVTRAEAVKIVACIVLGPSAASKLTASNQRFDDVPLSHWASAYIDWGCANPDNPILKGYGNGNFGPSDNVTFAQFSKMLLVALGYGYRGEFTSTDWIVNTMALATQNDFFKGYVDVASLMEVASSSNANRQECSLMGFNAMFAGFVKYIKDANNYEDVIDQLAIKNVSKIISLFNEKKIIDIVNNSDGIQFTEGKFQRSPASANFGFNPVMPFWATKTDGLAWISPTTFASSMEVLEVLSTEANMSYDFPFGYDMWGNPRNMFVYNGNVISENNLDPQLTYTGEVDADEIYDDLIAAGVTASQIKAGQGSLKFGSYVDGLDYLMAAAINTVNNIGLGSVITLAAWDYFVQEPGFTRNSIVNGGSETGATGNGVLTKVYVFTDYWGNYHTVITSVNTFLGDIDRVNTKDGEVNVGGFDPWSLDMQDSREAARDYEATGLALDDIVNFNYNVMPKALPNIVDLYSYLLSLEARITVLGAGGIRLDIDGTDLGKVADFLSDLNDTNFDEGTFGLQNLELADFEDGVLNDYNTIMGGGQVIVDDTEYVYNPMWVLDAQGYCGTYVDAPGAKGDTVRLYFDKYGNVLSLDGSVIKSNYALLLDAYSDFSNKYFATLYVLQNNGTFVKKVVDVSLDTFNEINDGDNNLVAYVDFIENWSDYAINGLSPSIVTFRDKAPGEANTVLLTEVTTAAEQIGRIQIDSGDKDLLFNAGAGPMQFATASNNTFFVVHSGDTSDGTDEWDEFNGIDEMDSIDRNNYAYSLHDHFNFNTNIAHIVWVYPTSPALIP